MLRTCIFKVTLLLLLLSVSDAALAALPMRPYSGIGVLQISSVDVLDQIRLYRDPGLSRCCSIPFAKLKALNAWLFGQEQGPFLIVTERKGNWVEIEHDDAGRTGWVQPERRWSYQPWEQFLKGRHVLFLRNSPKKQMQVLPRAGALEGLPVSPKQGPMKVIMAQEDWAYVLLDQSSAGWIRWRDSDSRLLIGFTGF